MIPRPNIVEKYLNYLLVFLFPTQLAFHFWPKYAFVYGIRVDYLSPTIYLTDIIFIVLFINFVIKTKKIFIKEIVKLRWILFLFLLVFLLNIFSSTSFFVSLFKWLKLVELIALGYYVFKNKEIFTNKAISNILFVELVFFSLIGIFQVYQGQTIGGIFYYLGERNFSTITPGIALINICGNNILRIYSTFSHPNSLAGFIGVIFIYLLFNKPDFNKYILIFGYVIAVVVLVLSFSMEAFVAMALSLIFYLFYKNRKIGKRSIGKYLLFTIIFSLILMLLSNKLIQTRLSLNESIRQRLELNLISGNVSKNYFLLGSGLNTFIITEAKYSNIKNTVWLLQPVHNIFLLIFVESGILGLLFFYIVLNKLMSTNRVLNNKCAVMIFVYILTTGMFDHYWFSLHQNLILVSFIVGLFLQKNNNKYLVK